MKKRVVKKAERVMLVDKVCELQMQIDEYERFIGDLLIMLTKREPQLVLVHKCGDFAGVVWEQTLKLIKEVKASEAQNLKEE